LAFKEALLSYCDRLFFVLFPLFGRCWRRFCVLQVDLKVAFVIDIDQFVKVEKKERNVYFAVEKGLNRK
jgi:hypothetical protein